MNKAQLVELAIEKLAWSRKEAEATTVGQLRLFLKEMVRMELRSVCCRAAGSGSTSQSWQLWRNPRGLPQER